MSVVINQTEKVYNVTVNQSLKQITTNIINQPKQVTVEVSALGKRGFKGDSGGIIEKISGEDIPSHTPIVLINDTAFKLDSSNILHQFAFVGFSTNGTSLGQTCIIKQVGEVVLIGWGLIPNQQYLAGVNGTLITENLSDSNFTKVIGYATNSDTLQIIKDSITINKL